MDLYSKFVLTTIAIALSVIALQGFQTVSSANASGHQIQRIAICDPTIPQRCARVKNRTLWVNAGFIGQKTGF
tara:strand:- start:100 stop:318 length:219 start_codon:yes stop_codon:yes gene_type:complete